MFRSYPYVRNKRLEQFKPKNIAKYGSSLLKKMKKLNLIATKYSNIGLQLKTTQMRFLLNQMYNKSGRDKQDSMSEEAWTELLVVSNQLELRSPNPPTNQRFHLFPGL